MNKLLASGCCALLLATTPTLATSIYRCVDETGHLTFTRQGCPTHQTSEKQQAFNPTPSSSTTVPMAKPQKQRTERRKKDQSLTIVGEQDDGCGNRMTGSARRNAMISQQSRPGMTRADIESTFGKPDSITSRNGQVQYRYSARKGRTHTISFDENGCVRGKH